MSSKYSVYKDSIDYIKPCVSAPTCHAHRHRPRPAPCPKPDQCYKKCIRKKSKCPSAMSIVTRRGSKCRCAKVQSKDTRRALRSCCSKSHNKRIRKRYRRNSKVSRWRRRGCCCTIL